MSTLPPPAKRLKPVGHSSDAPYTSAEHAALLALAWAHLEQVAAVVAPAWDEQKLATTPAEAIKAWRPERKASFSAAKRLLADPHLSVAP